MRIIAGHWKGTRLHAPSGTTIRPTADRLREAIFNIIGNRIHAKRVLDLYAGTGAMGLEALSRGACHATFVDRSPEALALIHRNMAKVDAADRATVIRWDITHSLHCLANRGGFDWVFIDPPYGSDLGVRTLTHLAASGIACGRIVVEHDARDPLAPLPMDLELTDQRRYGKSLVSFLRPMV